MTNEEYIDYISEELDEEIIRCEKICELLNEITSFDETKHSLRAYLKALKILMLMKSADVYLNLDEPSTWMNSVENQLRESRKHIEELSAKVDIIERKQEKIYNCQICIKN